MSDSSQIHIKKKARKVRYTAKVYAQVNNSKPREYWDYESFSIKYGYVVNLVL